MVKLIFMEVTLICIWRISVDNSHYNMPPIWMWNIWKVMAYDNVQLIDKGVQVTQHRVNLSVFSWIWQLTIHEFKNGHSNDLGSECLNSTTKCLDSTCLLRVIVTTRDSLKMNTGTKRFARSQVTYSQTATFEFKNEHVDALTFVLLMRIVELTTIGQCKLKRNSTFMKTTMIPSSFYKTGD